MHVTVDSYYDWLVSKRVDVCVVAGQNGSPSLLLSRVGLRLCLGKERESVLCLYARVCV